MSLINCPECGKQNVSDTAKACPQCGFDVSNYVKEKLKEQAIEEQPLIVPPKSEFETIKQLKTVIIIVVIIFASILFYSISNDKTSSSNKTNKTTNTQTSYSKNSSKNHKCSWCGTKNNLHQYRIKIQGVDEKGQPDYYNVYEWICNDCYIREKSNGFPSNWKSVTKIQ